MEETDFWHKAGSKESMGVNSAMTLNIGNMEPEKANSYILPCSILSGMKEITTYSQSFQKNVSCVQEIRT